MFIYKITSILSGKVYIGKTVRKDINVRWNEHKRHYRTAKETPLYKAFKKYGVDNFSFEVLYSNVATESDLIDLEISTIKQYNSNNSKLGYNQTAGGEGLRLCGDKNPMYGKKRYDLAAFNKSRKGLMLSKEHRDKISKGGIGRTASEETINKMSAKRKKAWQNGKYSSDEYKQKCRNAKAGVPVKKLYVPIVCNDTGEIFDSVQDAAIKYTGRKKAASNISSNLKGKLKSAYGHTFSYK